MNNIRKVNGQWYVYGSVRVSGPYAQYNQALRAANRGEGNS